MKCPHIDIPLGLSQVCICLLLMLAGHLSAQDIHVTDIPTIDQLPVNAIHCIFKDSEGYMWYGTVDGLCRDDGYHVEVFRSDIHTPGLLDDNRIGCIAESRKGDIWFGTDCGAYILEKQDYSIRPLDKERLYGRVIRWVHTAHDGDMWTGDNRGVVSRYDEEGTLVKEYVLPGRAGDVRFCHENRRHELLVIASGGLVYRWDGAADRFVPFPIGDGRINCVYILQDKEHDYYWLGTWGDGIVRFDPQASPDSACTYFPLPVHPSGEREGIIFQILQDEKYGYLWVLTPKGIVTFRPDSVGNLHQIHDFERQLPAHGMMAGMLDATSSLWIPAFDCNSFIIHLEDNAPKVHSLPAVVRRTNANPAIMALCDDGKGMMWMMQERTGLLLYDLEADRMALWSDFPGLKGTNLASGRELSFSPSHRGVWMTPDFGREVFCMGRNGMEMYVADRFSLDGKTEPGTYVTQLYEDRQYMLWIGLSNGIGWYDVKKKKLLEVRTAPGHVTGMAEDKEGRMWLCTKRQGVFRVDAERNLHRVESDKPFSCLTVSLDGTLWLGTENGGVYTYDAAEDRWTDCNEACGMDGNEINQIIADAYNHIWIGTNQKLVEYNPHNGSFRTYWVTDPAIQMHRFLPTASCQAPDGSLYWGGIPGICRVTPSNSLERGAAPTRVQITDVKIQGTSLLFDEHRAAPSQGVVLQPSDRNIEISFSSLKHSHASKIRYAYRLKGVDEEWTYTRPGKNTAFYHSLNKGDYLFQVKATDENGLWSKDVTELALQRLPAFYESAWAYLLYLLVIAGGITYILHRYLQEQARKQNELWADSKEMIKMRDYLDSKVNLPEPEYAQLDQLLLDKAIQTVEENLAEPDFDVAALAGAMNMSRSTLTRKLKAITGQTPLELIKSIKMKHARRLLEDKSKTVTEVATTLGYFNRKYFTSCFKEEFGMTPSEFQKSRSESKDS